MHLNVKSTDTCVYTINFGQCGRYVVVIVQPVAFIIRILNEIEQSSYGPVLQKQIRHYSISNLNTFHPFNCENLTKSKNLITNVIHHFYRYDDVLFRPKASFRWEIVSTKVRNRRDVIFSFADFVGSFGGAAALLLGVNIWQFAVVCLKILEKFAQILWRRE